MVIDENMCGSISIDNENKLAASTFITLQRYSYCIIALLAVERTIF